MRNLSRFIVLIFPAVFTIFNSYGRPEEKVQKQAELITTFNFIQLSGGVILVRAALDNYEDSLNFLLDTGSGGISLDSQTVERMQIPKSPSERTIRGIAGMRKVDFAYNHTLRFPGISIDSLNFHINDYDLLSAVYGLKVDGIIGHSFLSRYIVRIDYDRLKIEVYSTGEYKYPKGGQMLNPVIAGIPIQPAEITDRKTFDSRFFLDTGAGLCLLLSEAFCEDSSLFKPKRTQYETVTQGLGGKKEMTITIIKKFQLGSYRFKNVPVYIFDDEFNVTSYPYLAGLIGNDLLRRFNVVINYQMREIHLQPNTHFREEFDYSYTGLGLYAYDNEVYISDVIPGSPADDAGLQVGDVLVGLNSRITNNLQVYKELLQATGSRLQMIIRRNDELLETSIKIRSIRK